MDNEAILARFAEVDRPFVAWALKEIGMAPITVADPPVWPVDEWLSRHKCSPHVEARLRRLNPNGVREGEHPRGWHPSQRRPLLIYDCVRVRDFIRKHGRAAYDAAPKFRWGHRKAVSRQVDRELGSAV